MGRGFDEYSAVAIARHVDQIRNSGLYGEILKSRISIVEFFKIVSPDAHWQTSIAHNFASSYLISKILGSLERRILGLSNEPKIFEIR